MHNLIVERARTLTNGAAVTIDDEDEVVLTSEWSAAGDAFLHAAMALGAPELMSPADADLLIAAWKRLS